MQNNRGGVPMDEESLKEWQKSFQDIEDSIKNLYEEDKPKKTKAKKSNVPTDTNSVKVKKDIKK